LEGVCGDEGLGLRPRGSGSLEQPGASLGRPAAYRVFAHKEMDCWQGWRLQAGMQEGLPAGGYRPDAVYWSLGPEAWDKVFSSLISHSLEFGQLCGFIAIIQ